MQPRQGVGATAADVAGAGQEVVEQQAEPLLPRRHAGAVVKRQHEAQRADEVRGVAEQTAAFVQAS